MQLAEEKLQGEQARCLDALTRVSLSEIQLRAAQDQANDAVSAAAQAEEKLQAARRRSLELDDELSGVKKRLVNEMDVSASSRREIATLQKDLTELATVSTMASSKATEDRQELESIRRELASSIRREEAAVSEVCDQDLLLSPWASPLTPRCSQFS